MSRKPRRGAAEEQGIGIDQAIAMAYGHWNAGQASLAEQLCQQVLAVWPEHAEALHLLGLLAHGHGNLPLAVDFLRRAAATPSASATIYSNLAEICRQAGLLAEGEVAGRRAVALDALASGAWNNLGIILQEAGKLEESAACLLRVANQTPQNAEIHNNLGNTLKCLGRLEEALAHYQTALDLYPGYADAHANLANLLNDLGRMDEAEAAARRGIEENPHHPGAYINLAATFLCRGQHAEALRWLDNLMVFAPNHPGGLAMRARVLSASDQPEEAERAARLALAGKADHAEALEALALAQAALGQVEEALASFDKAASLPGGRLADILIAKGILLAEIGRSTEALALFDRVLSLNPRKAAAYFHRSGLASSAPSDEEVARMVALLGQNGVESFNERMMLHFALGKAHMDRGEDDAAFAHLADGNRMKRSSYQFDAEQTRCWMEGIAVRFTPEVLRRFAGAGDPSELPVFVIGMPRSGTTLVEQILASHPAVHGAGELPALQKIIDRITGPDLLPRPYPGLMDVLLPHDMATLGRDYVEQISRLAAGRRRVVDKMPANFLYGGLIPLILPNARIIHCRRDPVDTCLSCYTKLFSGEQKFAYDLMELGTFYRGYQTLTDHWGRILPADRFMEIRYEDVVADIEGSARRLVAFLGLAWDDACLDFHRTRRQVRTASLHDVRRPLYDTSVGRWRRHARHLAPLLTALGIDHTGSGAPP